MSADASSTDCDKRGLVRIRQLERLGSAGFEFVTDMGREKIV